MTILSDKQIRELCTGNNPMIAPFINGKSRSVNGRLVPSFGLGSYGYDITLSNEFKIPISGTLDPVNPNLASWQDEKIRTATYLLLPQQFVLAKSRERFAMPIDVTGNCLGKSSYARCGLQIFMTPLEAGWNGVLTLELFNPTPLPINLHIDGGICQIQFFRGEPCDNDYGNGIYQNQPDRIVTAGMRNFGY